MQNEKEKKKRADSIIEECQDKLRQAEQEKEYALTHQKKVEIPVEKLVLYERCRNCDCKAYQQAKERYEHQRNGLEKKYKAKTVGFDAMIIVLWWYAIVTTVFAAMRSGIFLGDFTAFFEALWNGIRQSCKWIVGAAKALAQVGDMIISFTGKHGSVIYLNNYLSVMFNISDVMIDKEEIAMKMQLPIHVPEEITIEDSASVSVSETVTDSQITVTKNDSCVPDSHMKFIVQKVAELLDSQGIPCCHCSKTRYILSPLSACKDIFNTFTLNIICPYGNAAYRFELSVSPGDESAQKMPAVAEPSALKGGE